MLIIKEKIDKTDVFAFIGYSALTALLTYPLILKMDHIAGGDSDVYPFFWILWWVKKAILELRTTPYFSKYLFYPSGVNLAFHPLIFPNSFVGIPLQFFFTPVVTYNILFLLTFILSGLGMYLLVKYLTKDNTAAFIAGVIFAFSPFRFAHALGHMTTITTQWIPFYALFLIKTVNEESVKNPILAGIFLVLVSLSSGYFMVFVFIFTFLYLGYTVVVDKNRIIKKEFGKRFFLGALLFGALISPFAYPMLKTALSESYMKKPIDSTFIMSADLFSFFVPPSFHPFFGGLVKGIYSRFTGNALENNLFVGYSVLLLALFAFIKKRENKEIRFWGLSAFVFFVLSLGPALHVLGRFIFPSPIPLGEVGKTLGITSSPLGKELMDKYVGIPLPYLLLYLFVPFFSITRTPSRFGIMLMLSLAVLAGYGISEFSKRFEGKTWHGYSQKNIFAIILSAVIIFEFLAIPFPVVSSSVPDFYLQLSRDNRDYAIVEVPIQPAGELMYYQTIHNKRILWGHIARIPPESTKFVESIPLLKRMQCAGKTSVNIQQSIIKNVANENPDTMSLLQKYLDSKKDIYSSSDESCEKQEISKNDVIALEENNIKYLLIYKGAFDNNSLNSLTHQIENVLSDPSPIYEDGKMIVYKIY